MLGKRPQLGSMKVLVVSVEAMPFAKVGGLADVVGALPKALRDQGHDARVVMPLYRMIEDDVRWQLATTLDDFTVEIGPHWRKQATFKETDVDGVPFGFVGTDEWFPLADRSETLYQPGGMQYLFLAQAVIQAMEQLDWIPDVIHLNDWHMGFFPVILREMHPDWDQVATVFTIHNQAYQGEFGLEMLDAIGLPHSLYHPERLETWGRVNFLKSGCVYSDQVNTVSETYAREIQTPEYGCTLEGLMKHLAGIDRLSGILNGIDTSWFNPEVDPHLPAHYSASDPSGKAACRQALLQELNLQPIPGAPVLGMVTRLSSQKGFDMLLPILEQLPELPAQLIVQGLGDPRIADALREAQAEYPNHIRFAERFDEGLAQRVYAGCDGFLMPSHFEPCGLGQMIAMRYGTVPVVRRTGGLSDTVFEGVNGFSFDEKSPEVLYAAIARLAAAYREPGSWAEMVSRGMHGDYSWARSAERYIALYAKAIRQRAHK